MTGWELAIDLGTTASAGAIRAGGGRPEVLEIDGARTAPSCVLLSGSELLAGVAAQRMSRRYPAAAVHDPKRKVGGAPFVLTDESGVPQAIPVGRALGAILQLFVAEGTRRHDGAGPSRLLLTHPARWTSTQREVIRHAAQGIAPRIPLTLVPEPVAAAFHHGGAGHVAAGGLIAVYDLGGGTFDTAVLRVGDAKHEVLGRPGGAAGIGGNAFDQLVYDHFGEQLAERAGEWWEGVCGGDSTRHLRDAQSVLEAARFAKEMLSGHESAAEYVPGANLDVTIDRAQYESLIYREIEESIRILDRTFDQAGVTAAEVSGIVLTGGASRTPLVSRLLGERYGAGKVHTRDDPKLSPVLGAFAWLDAKNGVAAPKKPAPSSSVPPPRTATAAPAKPAATKPAATKPAATRPATAAKPPTTKPASTKPATVKPATTKPATAKPAAAKPAATRPSAGRSPSTGAKKADMPVFDTITGSRTAAWVAFAIASAINFAVANAAGGRTNGVFLLGLVALACGWVPLAHGRGGVIATVAFLGALVAAYPLLADGSWWAPVVVWLTLIVLCLVAALAGDSVRILRRRR